MLLKNSLKGKNEHKMQFYLSFHWFGKNEKKNEFKRVNMQTAKRKKCKKIETKTDTAIAIKQWMIWNADSASIILLHLHSSFSHKYV